MKTLLALITGAVAIPFSIDASSIEESFDTFLDDETITFFKPVTILVTETDTGPGTASHYSEPEVTAVSYSNSTNFSNHTRYANTSDYTTDYSSASITSLETETTLVTITTEESSSLSSFGSASISVFSSASSSESSSTTTSYTGRGTWYEVGGDACGTSSTDSDLVCAISQTLYDSDVGSDEVSSYCGKYITASYNGKSVKVKVVDSCESCTSEDLDFSPTAFEELADLDVGELEITWHWD